MFSCLDGVTCAAFGDDFPAPTFCFFFAVVVVLEGEVVEVEDGEVEEGLEEGEEEYNRHRRYFFHSLVLSLW